MSAPQSTRPIVKYENLYPACIVEGCEELTEQAGTRCYPHLSDQVFKADRERQAELRKVAR